MDGTSMTESVAYTIRRARTAPGLDGNWDGPAWRDAATGAVDRFHAASSGHRPDTRFRAMYTDGGLHLIFRVRDRYVRATREDLHAMVCRDACVEFFAQPRADRGYLNFEVNCIGTLHASFVEDPTRTPDGLAKATRLPRRLAEQIPIHHSLSGVVYPEVPDDLAWTIEYFVPFAVFEEYLGALGPVAGMRWRGNFYKCAEDNSHPHWASWAPIGDRLNFHTPEHFAPLVFEA